MPFNIAEIAQAYDSSDQPFAWPAVEIIGNNENVAYES